MVIQLRIWELCFHWLQPNWNTELMQPMAHSRIPIKSAAALVNYAHISNMATSSKQPRTEDDACAPLFGFIHNVSPIKISRKNVRYFEAKLQISPEHYHRVVSFSIEKHNTLLQASKTRQPVKITGYRKTVSKYLPHFASPHPTLR